MNVENKGLGRIIIPDEQDKNYLMQAVLPAKASKRTYRYWNASGWWGDQGSTPQCVGYSWAHWVEDGPITHTGTPPIVPPQYIYTEAQKVDEWPGTNYDGTSVRAGAKVLQKKGYISQYLWAWDAATVAQAILEKGPVVVGTNWHYDMFYPDVKTNFVTATGAVVGGHAYVLDGVNMTKRFFRIKNSWGRTWGHKGYAYISFDDMDKLIKQQGEACLAVELKVETTNTTTFEKATVKPNRDMIGVTVYSEGHNPFIGKQ